MALLAASGAGASSRLSGKMVPLAGIEPALLAELDFELGPPGIRQFLVVTVTCIKHLTLKVRNSILHHAVAVSWIVGDDMVTTW